jgi:hypothetical protein
MIGEGDMFEDDAAAFLGGQVMEMADRLRVVNAAAPGSAATYAFECDDVTFELTMKVRP